jgi:hypothetical protein
LLVRRRVLRRHVPAVAAKDLIEPRARKGRAG